MVKYIETDIKTTNPARNKINIRVVESYGEVGIVTRKQDEKAENSRAIYIHKEDLPRLIEKLKEAV